MRIRKAKGNQVAEFGPAVFIFVCMVFIPMLDLFWVGLGYVDGWWCNYVAIRAACMADPHGNGTSVLTPQQAAQDAVNAWLTSGLGGWLHGVAAAPVVQSNQPPDLDGDGFGDTVIVSTKVTINPWMPIPFFCSIPGMNAPVTFIYADQRPEENRGFN